MKSESRPKSSPSATDRIDAVEKSGTPWTPGSDDLAGVPYERSGQYWCSVCALPFMLFFARSEEELDLVPVECPRCSAVTFVGAPQNATLDYQMFPEQSTALSCDGCRDTFEVAYFAEPGGQRMSVSVACPSCGWVNPASVGRRAVATRAGAPPFQARRRTGQGVTSGRARADLENRTQQTTVFQRRPARTAVRRRE